MIDFRYHIVSLVAVFLALGIGVAMGSTVLDQVIVRRQKDLLTKLNNEVRTERLQRLDAQGQLSQYDRFTSEGAQFFVGGRLAGQVVLVSYAQGVPKELVDAEVQILRQANAAVPATIEFTPKWELKEGTAREQLQLRTGAPSNDAPTLYSYAVVELAAKLGNAQPSEADRAKLVPEKAATILKGLSDDGFLKINGVDNAEIADPNALTANLAVIIGADDVKVPLDQFYVPWTLQMALGKQSLAGQGQVPGGQQVYLGKVKANPTAMATMTTVDNLNTRVGQVSSVVGLQVMPSGVFAQLGTCANCRLLPERTAK